ncbi:MAG: hypothetical protein HY863_01370 [Chloroflexi bacterium]|nr:hypothetical protein [Chloroflexota bacterium]
MDAVEDALETIDSAFEENRVDLEIITPNDLEEDTLYDDDFFDDDFDEDVSDEITK